MRKKYIFGKKLYISILTSIVVLLTTVATTFAWIGVFANSVFDQFEFNIRASNLEEYGIEISPTGEVDSFSDSIDGDTIKRQILHNWEYTDEEINASGINDLFNSLNMEQCTTKPVVSAGKLVSLGDFTNIEGNSTKSVFKFDIYISAVQFYDSGNSTSDFKLDVFLNKGLISGNVRSKILLSPFIYPSNFVNPLSAVALPTNLQPVEASTKITSAKVNSKSVCRVAFEKYEVVEKYNTLAYENKTPVSTVIYSGDSYNYPTYNEETSVYEFGGILQDDLNLSVGYYNSTEWLFTTSGIKTVSVEDTNASVCGKDIYDIRGVTGSNPDLVFNGSTNQLINSNDTTEKIGINEMMKVTVSFWIEGWDADCFNAIGRSPVTISVSLSMKDDEEFV